MLAQVSIFGRDVEWDYFGAWRHTVNHGYAHVAKSQDVSGMKLWSWGNAPVGVVNQTALTDDGSVYAETQCGAMETQLDFAFLQPGKIRAWREWWLPLRGMGGLTSASESLASRISLIPNENDETISLLLALCPVMDMKQASVKLSVLDKTLLEKTISMSPENPWSETITIDGKVLADNPITILVKDSNDNTVLEIIHNQDDDEKFTEESTELPAKESADGFYQQGLKHENFDNREQAKEAYRKTLELNDAHEHAHLRYGLMLLVRPMGGRGFAFYQGD